MRLNIFRIPEGQVTPLREKLTEAGLASTKQVTQDGWSGEFLFSETPKPGPVSWATTFSDYLPGKKIYNKNYFATFLLEKGDTCYALSFGKSHFYIRPFCDYDFGIELAKRIADEEEVKQTSAKRYQGKQRKDIKSFGNNARLNIPAGESIDFIQASIINSKAKTFGISGKFGTSAQVSPDIDVGQIGKFLTTLGTELDGAPRFKLPRTVVLSDEAETAKYDDKLLDELTSPIGTTDFATNTYDLFGVDFIFSSVGSFTLKCGHYRAVELEQLTMKDVKEYIAERKIPRDKLLQLRVTHRREGEPTFSQTIKEALDFICDDESVVLTNGKWLRFNQDYLEYLSEAIRQISIEATEPEYLEITAREAEFNSSLHDAGYVVADKDFSIFKTRSSTPVEAWDLQKGDTVYAVKFGTPQKLNYVVDQAMSVLELLHNRAEVKEVPHFERYCLWLGYQAKALPPSIADTGSIILKQKIDAWARRCEELGIEPVLKMSRKVKPDLDAKDVVNGVPEIS